MIRVDWRRIDQARYHSVNKDLLASFSLGKSGLPRRSLWENSPPASRTTFHYYRRAIYNPMFQRIKNRIKDNGSHLIKC